MFLTKGKKMYWRTKDKELIRLKDISDSHLENIRMMLIRHLCMLENMWDACESFPFEHGEGHAFPPSTRQDKEWIKIITREQAYRER